MPLEENSGIDTSNFWKQVTTAFNWKGHGIHAYPIAQGTHKWWAIMVVWDTSHIHEVCWQIPQIPCNSEWSLKKIIYSQK